MTTLIEITRDARTTWKDGEIVSESPDDGTHGKVVELLADVDLFQIDKVTIDEDNARALVFTHGRLSARIVVGDVYDSVRALVAEPKKAPAKKRATRKRRTSSSKDKAATDAAEPAE